MIEFPSQERFKTWLQRLPQDKPITTNWTSENCPLCAFLKEHGADDPEVTPWTWSEDSMSAPRKLPGWAQEFTSFVDQVKPREVTPEDCLFIMDLPYFRPSRWA